MKNRVITALLGLTTLFAACEKDSSAEPTTPVRLLPLSGAYNVRDCGGYGAADGKTVKWRTVFRSGDLNKLTEGDLNYLRGIKYIVDFRGVLDGEAGAAPDKAPVTLLSSYSFPIEAGNVLDMAQMTTPEKAFESMCTLNRWLVDECQSQYASFFGILQGGRTPLLFHCSAGKDRAGLAGALFLSSLGVDRQTVINDYMLSAGYVAEKYAAYVAAMPALGPVFTTEPEFIEAALDHIDANYGGMESYLTNNLRVDLAKMRNLYTE